MCVSTVSASTRSVVSTASVRQGIGMTAHCMSAKVGGVISYNFTKYLHRVGGYFELSADLNA